MVKKRKKQPSRQKFKQLITKFNPSSPVSEQYRTVRTNLQFSSADRTIKSILVSSAGPEEGKSFSAANLAIVYAQQGQRVLFIDADMRKPTAHYTFRLDNLNGLSTMLAGDISLENAASMTDIEELDVLSSGPIPPNPSELLSSNAMEQVISDAEQIYDLILLDTPPIMAVTDAQILANMCDGSLLVVRSKQTEYDLAEKSINILESSNAKFLGTLLNDVEKKKTGYYDYYGTP